MDVPSVVHFCKLHFSKHIFFNNLHVINNIHAKISARSLAKSTSIYPKQCRKLKFFECKKLNYNITRIFV